MGPCAPVSPSSDWNAAIGVRRRLNWNVKLVQVGLVTRYAAQHHSRSDVRLRCSTARHSTGTAYDTQGIPRAVGHRRADRLLAPDAAEQQVVNDAAAALGGSDRIAAVKMLVLEGEATQHNLGQDVTPGASGQTFTVTGYRRAIDVSGGRARTELTRQPNFTFFQGPAAQRQVAGIDRAVAYNVAANGNATRVVDVVASDRRAELIYHPVTTVRAVTGAEERLAGPVGREMKPEAADTADNAPRNFEQVKTERADRRRPEARAGEDRAAEVGEQQQRDAVELQPEGVRAEAMTAKPVGVDVEPERLDPIFGRAAVVVPRDQIGRAVAAIRDHEAQIEALGGDVDFDEETSGVWSRLRATPKTRAVEDGSTRSARTAPSPRAPPRGP